ncbi:MULTISPECIES: YtpI family protein [Exiguobacterium]|nr:MULTISPECIES: YtpI family protein [Exiguobacterium]MCM3279112.1 YtpI family protein [Exiguobacterium sp. MER 193]MDX5981640.1 YtpI family protein [Exiguobacterium profundum]WED56311.1 YtpI family protein [Exiguobacterium profundum]
MQLVMIGLILFALGAYLVFKRRAFLTKTPNRKALFNTQALIWLSLFLALFAANQMVGGFGLNSTVGWIVSIVMLVVGLGNAVVGFIRYRKIYPLAAEEPTNTPS